MREIIRSAIDGLKEQPLILGLLLIDLVFIAFLYWFLSEISKIRAQDIAQTRAAIDQAKASIDQQRDVLIELQRTCVRFEPRSDIGAGGNVSASKATSLLVAVDRHQRQSRNLDLSLPADTHVPCYFAPKEGVR